MSASKNKAIMEAIFAALAEGDRRPFGEAMAEDFVWHVPGTTSWSGSYKGRDAVRTMLLRPLFSRFATRYRNRATRIMAEGDIVVVECRGTVRTIDGKDYDNSYCMVCRFAGGKLAELNEYMDTKLMDDALGDYRAALDHVQHSREHASIRAMG